MSTCDPVWVDAVVEGVRDLPAALRWRVEAGVCQTLPPTKCHSCNRSEFRIVDARSVACFGCGATTSADAADCCEHPWYVDLGRSRQRMRIVVRPLDGTSNSVINVTRWPTELAGGFRGCPHVIRDNVSASFDDLARMEGALNPEEFARRLAQLAALTQVEPGPAIVHVEGGGWVRPSWSWHIQDKVTCAVLATLGCRRPDGKIWRYPDRRVVFEADREKAWVVDHTPPPVPLPRKPPTPRPGEHHEGRFRELWVASVAVRRLLVPNLAAGLSEAVSPQRGHLALGAARAALRQGEPGEALATVRAVMGPVAAAGRIALETALGDRDAARRLRAHLHRQPSDPYVRAFRERVRELRMQFKTYYRDRETARIDAMLEWAEAEDAKEAAASYRATMAADTANKANVVGGPVMDVEDGPSNGAVTLPDTEQLESGAPANVTASVDCSPALDSGGVPRTSPAARLKALRERLDAGLPMSTDEILEAVGIALPVLVLDGTVTRATDETPAASPPVRER